MRWALPAVALMRQQPSIGNLRPLAQKCGALVCPGAMLARSRWSFRSSRKPVIVKCPSACWLPHHGNLICIEPSASTNRGAAMILPSAGNAVQSPPFP